MIAIRLLAALVIVVFAGSAFGEDVAVRGWSHAKFGRLVFDWPSPVEYTASVRNRQLSVRFDKPIAARFEAALGNLGDYVTGASISQDGRTALFDLKSEFTLRAFRNENAIVLDLRRPGQQATRKVPQLGVRIGEHPTYTRLVFDWNRAVDYNADLQNSRLQLRFNKPATIDLAALRRQLPPDVRNPKAATRDGGLDLALNVTDGTRLRHFRSGTKVVVDLLVKSDAARKPEPQKRVQSPETTAPSVPQAASQDSLLAAAQKAIANAKSQAASAKPRRLIPEKKPDPEPAPEPDSAPSVAPKPPEIEKVAEAPEVKAGETPTAEAPPEPKRTGFIAKAVRESNASSTGKAPPPLVSLVFEWPEPVGAAVFERAGYVWVIFDKRAPIDLAPLRERGKGLVSRMEQLPIGNATVLRMSPSAGVGVSARRDGTNWSVEFRRGRTRPEIQIGIDADPDAEGGARLFFPVLEAGSLIRLPDPEVGDLIQVATLQASGQGIAGQRAYPEFQILASAQGLAVVGLNDDVELEKIEAGLALTVPGGLHISGISPDTSVGRSAPSGRARRIFKISEWQKSGEKDYYTARQKLQDVVARQPVKRRDASRLKLAQFYFARGMAPEAKGVLQVIEAADPRTGTKADFKALKGAVAALMGETNNALKNLSDPRLEKYEEIQLWRGVAAAGAEKWKDAQLLFKRADAVLHAYPEPLKSKLGLLRIETALKTRDSGSASRWLSTLAKKTDKMTRGELATLRYLQGRLAFIEQDIDRATELWAGLQDSGDTWNASRAELSLINMELLQSTISEEEAIERLEDLRYRWRGDEFELQVLRRLGGLYLDKEDYRGGLGTYRVIATYFPQHPDTKRIAQAMTDTFKKLYLNGLADELPPLTALALYDEFRELTPAGPDGNLMIQKLSERLVDVDLLNRAADLLEHQVKFRLQGEERAVVGAKLALIRLLDRDPEKAVKALRMTTFPRLPEQLDDDRRRIQARAVFEIGRINDAIELLAGDVSRNADLLRADIQWRSENWPEAAKVLQRLAGDPPPEGTTFDGTEAQVVLNWAVALRLDRDESGLEVIRELYGPAMAASPLSKAFQFIASASESDAPLDLETITSRIADNGVFDAFLAEYLADNKKRLLNTPVAPEQPPEAAPPPPQVEAPQGGASASG